MREPSTDGDRDDRCCLDREPEVSGAHSAASPSITQIA
jgi:hypothetical protein